jgi:hypothetical protein
VARWMLPPPPARIREKSFVFAVDWAGTSAARVEVLGRIWKMVRSTPEPRRPPTCGWKYAPKP